MASSCAPSAVHPNPPTKAAQPASWARSSSTSRTCGYGALGSASRSSPSSQQPTSPRSATGANAAARVPTRSGPGPGGRRGTCGSARPVPARRSGPRAGRRRAPRCRQRRDARRRDGLERREEHRARWPASPPPLRRGTVASPRPAGRSRPRGPLRHDAARRGRPARCRRRPTDRRRRTGRKHGSRGRRARGRGASRDRTARADRLPALPGSCLALDPGMPRGYGEPQHVGERSRVPVGDEPGQPGHLGRQDGFGRDDPAERSKPPAVLRTRLPGRGRSRRGPGRRTGPGPGTGTQASCSRSGTR